MQSQSLLLPPPHVFFLTAQIPIFFYLNSYLLLSNKDTNTDNKWMQAVNSSHPGVAVYFVGVFIKKETRKGNEVLLQTQSKLVDRI